MGWTVEDSFELHTGFSIPGPSPKAQTPHYKQLRPEFQRSSVDEPFSNKIGPDISSSKKLAEHAHFLSPSRQMIIRLPANGRNSDSKQQHPTK
jgi:hypothetical protein